MKTTIEIPDELFRKAKATAALHGQSMKQFITQILQREMGEIPATSGATRKKAAASFDKELEALALRVSRDWQNDVDATQAIRDQRRDL